MSLLSETNQGPGAFINPKLIKTQDGLQVVDAETGQPIKPCGCTAHHWATQFDQRTGAVTAALIIEGLPLPEER